MTTAFLQNDDIVILQDVRRRYASEGRWRPLGDDVRDGVDAAAWIGAQSWSDGISEISMGVSVTVCRVGSANRTIGSSPYCRNVTIGSIRAARNASPPDRRLLR